MDKNIFFMAVTIFAIAVIVSIGPGGVANPTGHATDGGMFAFLSGLFHKAAEEAPPAAETRHNATLTRVVTPASSEDNSMDGATLDDIRTEISSILTRLDNLEYSHDELVDSYETNDDELHQDIQDLRDAIAGLDGSDSAPPHSADLQGLQDAVEALDERVSALENSASYCTAGTVGEGGDRYGSCESFCGDQTCLSAVRVSLPSGELSLARCSDSPGILPDGSEDEDDYIMCSCC